MLVGYLAGPIENVTVEEASNWRNDLKQYFKGLIVLHDPMYAELVAVRNAKASGKECDKSVEFLLKSDSIFGRDLMMINNSNFLLVNMIGMPHTAIGTIFEIGYAHAKGKTIIVISDEEKVKEHPFIKCACVVFSNMRDARKYLVAIAQDFY